MLGEHRRPRTSLCRIGQRVARPLRTKTETPCGLPALMRQALPVLALLVVLLLQALVLRRFERQQLLRMSL